MRVRSIEKQMFGSAIVVLGTRYELDDNGVIMAEVPEDHAKALGVGANWSTWRVAKPTKDATLPIPQPRPPAAKPAPLPPPPLVPEVEEKIEEIADWPMPEEAMDIAYLRLMADAYGVRVGSHWGKRALVRNILKARDD